VTGPGEPDAIKIQMQNMIREAHVPQTYQDIVLPTRSQIYGAQFTIRFEQWPSNCITRIRLYKCVIEDNSRERVFEYRC